MEVAAKSLGSENEPIEQTIAFSYRRLSSKRQLEGDGQRRQTEEAEEYCARMGLKLDQTLTHIGSAWTGENRLENTELGRFLDMAKNGHKIPHGSHLIVESLDRLSRDKVTRAFRLFSDLLEAGIVVHTIADGKIYTEKSITENFGDLIVSLSIMMRANDESNMKAHRQRKTWAQKRANAGEKKLSAKCPTWLELSPDRKTFIIKEDRKLIIQRIFKEAADGFGCDSIARRLNKEGKAPFANGRLWHGGTVRSYLQSKAVLGHYQPNRTVRETVRDGENKGAIQIKRVPDGDVITDYYPQIVSNEVWHRAWGSIDSRRLGKPSNAAGRRGSVLTNLFSGFGKCVYCDSPMNVRSRGTTTRHRHKPFLICSKARNGVCPNNRQFTLLPLEDAVLDFVQEINLRETEPAEAKMAEKELAAKLIKGNEVQQRIDRLNEAIAAGSKSALNSLLKEEAILEGIQQEIRGYEQRLESIQSAVPLADRQMAIKQLRERLQVANGEERYEIRTKLRQALREIVTFMTFVRDGSVALSVKGNDVAYLFRDGKLVRRLEQPLKKSKREAA